MYQEPLYTLAIKYVNMDMNNPCIIGFLEYHVYVFEHVNTELEYSERNWEYQGKMSSLISLSSCKHHVLNMIITRISDIQLLFM